MDKKEVNQYIKDLESKNISKKYVLEISKKLKKISLETENVFFNNYNEEFLLLLDIITKFEYVSKRKLYSLIFKQLNFKYVENNILSSDFSFLANDLVLLKVLTNSINNNLIFEHFLTDLRKNLLYNYLENPSNTNENIITLTACLAQQSFNNEHIFSETIEEVQEVIKIENKLINGKNDLYSLFVYEMYKPLYRLNIANKLSNKININSITNKFQKDIIKRILFDPLKEIDIKNTIPCISKEVNETSILVRNQYEENPYPRWIEINTNKKKSLFETLNERYEINLNKDFPNEEIEILIAGSGTGSHPIRVAISNPNLKITAIDLSLSSLAYGKRKAKEYGINNIEFLQGDILNLPNLNKKFHYIDSAGVIHHTKDQFETWKALHSVLLEGGIFNISVYSEVARMHISFLRNKISKFKLGNNKEDIKNFRKDLIEGNNKNLLNLVSKGDFYSVSVLRDLLFHVSEYQYKLSEIEEFINKLSFEFLGFYFSSNGLHKKYQKEFPHDSQMRDFKLWKKFEMQYAGSSEMFRFYLRKPKT